jgi:hypothetical protein
MTEFVNNDYRCTFNAQVWTSLGDATINTIWVNTAREPIDHLIIRSMENL